MSNRSLRFGVWREAARLVLIGFIVHGSTLRAAPTLELDPAPARVLGAALEIEHPDYRVDDWHGWSVAVAGDRAMVGAPLASHGASTRRGAVYAFERLGATWTQHQVLLPPVAGSDGYFGISVAMTIDRAVVGIVGANGDLGAVGFYRLSGSRWVLESELTASGLGPGDDFGWSVAIDGDTALVGAPEADSGVTIDTGAVFVYSRSAAGWGLQAILRGSAAASGDRFGEAVALSGDIALIGAPNDGIGPRSSQGSAYVFHRASTGTWNQTAHLVATGGSTGDRFGTSVDIDGTTAIIGAPHADGIESNAGVAYVYQGFGVSIWTLQQRLDNSAVFAPDEFGMRMGQSVAVLGDMAYVGVPGWPVAPVGHGGAVLTYRRTGSTWQSEAVLSNTHAGSEFLGAFIAVDANSVLATTLGPGHSPPEESRVVHAWSQPAGQTAPVVFRGSALFGDAFGISVAHYDDVIVVGVPSADVDGVAGAGAAHVFRRQGPAWQLEARLRASDGGASSFFGVSVAMDATRVYVSAPFAPAGNISGAGAVYVFERIGTSWTQQARLQPLEVGADQFGIAMSVSGDTLFIGAPDDDIGGLRRGSVVPFTHIGAAWVEGPKIIAPDGVDGDRFGAAVASRGDILFVGAPATGFPFTRSGSAHVFTRRSGHWSRTVRFDVVDPVDANDFGASIALGDGEVFIGAFNQDVLGSPSRGAVYHSIQTAETWSVPNPLPTSLMTAGSHVGTALALAGDVLLVGAVGDDVGRVLRYERVGSTFQEVQVLTNTSSFGFSIAWDGQTAIVGDPQHSPFPGTSQVGRVLVRDELGLTVFENGFE